jgi:predicted dehydrogenase
MSDQLSWGILGTGHIAGVFARCIAHSETGRLIAVASRTQDKAEKFGKEFELPNRHGSYELLLADPNVEAVYISTPHPMHAEWSIKSADAGKHILCEKPLAMNHAAAAAMVEAARRNNVFLMEAFMYRCHPQTAKIVDLVREGAIGEVRVIHAAFGFQTPWDPTSRVLAWELGGGGILDVGCYPVSMVRLIAGAAMGKDFADPIEVTGTGYLGKTGVDEWAVASLQFESGIVADLSCAVSVQQDNHVRVFGSEGYIDVPWPWAPAKEGGTARVFVYRSGQTNPKEFTVETRQWLYALEADMVAANRDRLEATPPAMTWADSLGNMMTLDRWREAIGLVYDADAVLKQ